MKNKLREFRKDRNMTQKEFADLIGVARPTITLIESNKHIPDIMTVAKIVKALGVPANKIFEDLDVAQ